MSQPVRPDVTAAVAGLTGGDERAAAQLMDFVYSELRSLANGYFRGQEAQTLQPTALVHEAFVRVAEKTGAHLEDRAQFAAICAVAMRGILADHARRRRAKKRGGDWHRVTLAEVGTPGSSPSGAPGGDLEIDALTLDEALTALAQRSERQARVVEYRYFAGMTVPEVMSVLGVSRSTVENDWRMARAWLKVQLQRGTDA